MCGPDASALRAEAGRWLDHADEDRRMVALALGAAPPFVGPAAYHAQQAAEKTLKALLVLRGATVPRSHDLAYLLSLTGPLPDLDAAGADEVAALTAWATQPRYPHLEDDGAPTAGEVTAILPILEGCPGRRGRRLTSLAWLRRA